MKIKGDKLAKPFFEAMYGKKSFTERQQAALDLGLNVAAPAAADEVIDAEPIETEEAPI